MPAAACSSPKKGRGGGFILAKDPAGIFLTDLIAVFQGPLRLSDCVFGKRLCRNHGSCLLRRKIDAAERAMLAELGKVTLKDLLGGGAR